MGRKNTPGGKRTITTLSKKEAIWNVSLASHFISRSGNIGNAILRVPTGFLDGNNDIIKIKYISPQTNDIKVHKEIRQIEIKYENIPYKEGNF